MGIREFSHPAGVSWAGADWCLGQILAAGEGPIPGDWEDQGERSRVGRRQGPGTCCSLALPQSLALVHPLPRDSTSRKKGPTSQPGLRDLGLWGQGGSAGLAQFVAWRGSIADRWQHVRGSGRSREGCQMAPPAEEQGPWALRIWRGCVPAAPSGWQGR